MSSGMSTTIPLDSLDTNSLDDTGTNSSFSTQELAPNSESIKLYKDAIQETLDNIFSALSIEELNKIFKDVPLKKIKLENIMPDLRKILIEQVNTNMMDLVDKHSEIVGLKDQFTLRDTIIKDNKQFEGTTAWRPSRNVDENLLAYRIRQKKEMKKELEQMLSIKKKAVKKLKHDVELSRSTISNILSNSVKAKEILNQISDDIDKNIQMCNEIKKFVLSIENDEASTIQTEQKMI